MIRSLGEQLLPELKNASEFYGAVALMNDFGFKAIEEALPEQCLRVYLIGVHLPTPPEVFRKLLKTQNRNPRLVFARVWLQRANYHPKVYIIRKQDGEVVVFMGSANATRGGFERNIEISVRIFDPPQCNSLFEWFTEMFMMGRTFDTPYIDNYERTYRRNKHLQSTQKSNNDNFTNNAVGALANVTVPNGQFFTQADFDAFAPSTHFSLTSNVVKARAAVRERFKELDGLMRPRFPTEGIKNLNRHPSAIAITSQHWHSRGHYHIPKEALWLHYGKSTKELSRYAIQDFTDNLRIQVILRHSVNEAYIGIWLYVAKNNGSYYDRLYLQTHLSAPGFIQDLFKYLTNLGSAYWIDINGNRLYIENMIDLTTLENFIRLDRYLGEFNIGRIYHPDDPDLSEENIVDTVLVEFSKLYKIYDLIKDR